MAFWKEDWTRAQDRFEAWWARTGLALYVTAPKDEPWEIVSPPEAPLSVEQQWLDPAFRVAQSSFAMSRTFYGGVAFPFFDTQIGPGSLGTFLGSEPGFAPDTVW